MESFLYCEFCDRPEGRNHDSSCPANPENQKHLIDKFGEFATIGDPYFRREKESSSVVERPWGTFEVLAESKTFPYWKLKRIKINPNQSISLQYHNNRDETWTIIKGHGSATADGIGHSLVESEFAPFLRSFFIPAQARHKITASSEGVEFFELATSLTHPIDEEDIVRIEDMYGRV